MWVDGARGMAGILLLSGVSGAHSTRCGRRLAGQYLQARPPGAVPEPVKGRTPPDADSFGTFRRARRVPEPDRARRRPGGACERPALAVGRLRIPGGGVKVERR